MRNQMFKQFLKTTTLASVLLAFGACSNMAPVTRTEFNNLNTDLGLSQLMQGNISKADSYFDKALASHDDDVYALMGKAMVYDQLGQEEQAALMYEQILALSPSDENKINVMAMPMNIKPLSQLSDVRLSMLNTSKAKRASRLHRINKNVPDYIAQIMKTYGVKQPQANVISRFETLESLLNKGLITPEEYNIRRKENIGALAPLTQREPSIGLDAPVPSTAEIENRLKSLSKALELKAISVNQFTGERNTILDGLVPSAPQQRLRRPAPPSGLLASATAVSQLEAMKTHGLLTNDEYAKERAAIEHGMYHRTSTGTYTPHSGSYGSGGTLSSASTSGGASGGTTNASTKKATGYRRPAVYISSYTSKNAATDGWKRLSASFPTQLAGKHPVVTIIDVPERGTFYRLSVGPFSEMAKASEFCGTLKDSQIFCRAGLLDFSKAKKLQ